MNCNDHPYEAVIMRTNVLISGMCLAGGSDHNIVLHIPDQEGGVRRKEGIPVLSNKPPNYLVIVEL